MKSKLNLKMEKTLINIKEYYNCNYYHSFEKEMKINEVSGNMNLRCATY